MTTPDPADHRDPPPGATTPPYPPGPALPPPPRDRRFPFLLGLIAAALLFCLVAVAGSLLAWGSDIIDQVREQNRQQVVPGYDEPR